jgi:plastocyanin
MNALLAALALLSPIQTYDSKPIDISGYETRRASVTVPSPPLNGFLTRMRAEVVDDHDRPVPQQIVMLHHVLFMNKGRFRGDRTSSDCRANQPHEKFYGTGEEAQELVLPDGYGYRVRKGDVWKMSYMLMNHTAKAARVHLRYTMTLSSAALTPVTPYWVTLACGNGKIFNITGGGRPGSVDRRTRDWTVPQTGHIVAGMAHAHGGTLGVSLSRPRCDGELLSSDPQYGAADDPIYNVSPVLHEPSPRSMSVATSAKGWPVKRGETLRLTASYDNERPHVAVMGIMHVYIAKGLPPASPCPAEPKDVEAHRLPFPGAPGRPTPPRVSIDLSERGADGAAEPIADLPGAFSKLGGNATVDVRNAAFSPRKLSVPAGSTISWRFDDKIQHDVTVVGGPRGFASNYTSRGVTYSRKLTVPGTYRIFCSLHPVDMNQVVEVRAPR